MTAFLRQAWVALRLLVVATVALGIVYPLAVTAVGRLAADRADGSFVTSSDGAVVGSSLIGQAFDGPQWFQSRPSAAGDGYDAEASGGSNLAADNPALVDEVVSRKDAIVRQDRTKPQDVPADAVTASGSGLDPHISPAYALQQVDRVARARDLDPAQVRSLVDAQTEGRTLGFIGEPRVNVLELNLALEALDR